MTRWLVALLHGLRLEGQLWLRTREVHLYLLLPSVLIVPFSAVVATLFASLQAAPRVVVPLDIPDGLELVQYLEEEGLDVVAAADPWAAWQAGEVDGAVVSVSPRAGIAHAVEAVETWTVRSRYEVRAIAANTQVERSLKAGVRHAGDDTLEGWVALAGGDPGDAWLADVHRVPLAAAEDPSDRRTEVQHHWAVLYIVGLATMLGSLVLPAQCVSDRRSGMLEALAATASPMSALWLARVVVFSALQATAVAGLFVSLWLLIPDFPALQLWVALDALDLVAVLCVANALMLAPGLATVDLKGAMNWGPMAALPLLAVLLASALQIDVPGWPVLSAGVQGPAPLRVLGALGTFAIAMAVVGVISVVFRGDRLLPPSGGPT